MDDRAIPVIFDPLLVPSIKGCIYLYNSERDAIVQYTWNIVQKLLEDVDKAEKSSIKKAFDGKWKSARKRFTKGKVDALTTGSYKGAVSAPPAPVMDNRWDAAEDDSFELDDLG